MENMNHDHMHGLNNQSAGGMMQRHRMMMMMHMTFYWGNNPEILFSGWWWSGTNVMDRHSTFKFDHDTRTGIYVFALIVVFMLGFLVEWISHSQLIKPGPTRHVAAGLVQTLLHALRVGLSYLVMLAIKSFNGGVFLAAVAGHALGFLLFGSRVFKKSSALAPGKTSDLPPMSC